MLAAAVLIKVLIVTGTTDLPYHDWRVSTPFLRAELSKTGRFEIKVAEEPRGLNAAALAGYDVILWHYNGPRLGQEAESAIEGFVRSGKGFVSFHGVTYGACYGQTRQASGKYLQDAEAWPAYADLVGATWKVENIGHSARHVFPVKYVDRAHPIAAGTGETFTANDELYHKLDLRPGVRVVATAYSDKAKGGTGKDEPMLWVNSFGAGRIAHCPLGHDISAMAMPGFLRALSRSLEWAASGAVTNEAAPAADKARVLVVTGGHGFPTEFFSLFEGDARIQWSFAGTQADAFGRKLAGRFDTIVFHDMGETIGEKEQANLREFVEAGGGIVSTHHAIVNYTSWPWWYEEVIGGKYFVKEVPGHTKSAYKEGVDFVATAVKAMQKHPVMAGVPPLPVHDEVYKNMWISPKVQVLMETDHPDNDRPVVYVGPHEKARVVYIQLGHSASTLVYPGYRNLVRNAILWTARKVN
ncbi:MAG: ThuA domain-containing protein [Acidobacteria bacterium]|nr:ThuA domain-containing protein [Acidobacteriota bacterium]